jgi:sodium/proline symporter
VLVAWSVLGASLGALLLVRLLGWPLSTYTAMAMIAASIVTVAIWQVSGLDGDLFKLMPGMLAAFAVYGIGRVLEGAFR